MREIEIYVTEEGISVTADMTCLSGTVGIPVHLEYDALWSGLRRTLLFRAGGVCVAVADVGDRATVPQQVLQKNCTLQVGLYGVSPQGDLALPTQWATVGLIAEGTDTEADPAADPALPVWQYVLLRQDSLEAELKTYLQDMILGGSW